MFYSGISKIMIQNWISENEEHTLANPIFDNKDKLKPIKAKKPMDQMQIDLVDLSHNTCEMNGVEYNYVFCALDVFSRFLVLLPMEGKSAEEAALRFREVTNIIGLPKRLQCDRGSEFKGRILFVGIHFDSLNRHKRF